jgi:fucose permease
MFAAGSGAAVLALLNIVTTAATVQYVMAVPAVCFAAIAVFALVFRRADKAAGRYTVLAGDTANI